MAGVAFLKRLGMVFIQAERCETLEMREKPGKVVLTFKSWRKNTGIPVELTLGPDGRLRVVDDSEHKIHRREMLRELARMDLQRFLSEEEIWNLRVADIRLVASDGPFPIALEIRPPRCGRSRRREVVRINPSEEPETCSVRSIVAWLNEGHSGYVFQAIGRDGQLTGKRACIEEIEAIEKWLARLAGKSI